VKSYNSKSASIGSATHHAGALSLSSRTLAPPSRRCAMILMSWAVAHRYRAARLSTALVKVIFRRTRTEELHLDEHVNCSTCRESRTEQDARRKTGTARAGMSSDWGNTLTHALVAEPCSSVQVRMGALQVVVYSRNRAMCSLASCRTRHGVT